MGNAGVENLIMEGCMVLIGSGWKANGKLWNSIIERVREESESNEECRYYYVFICFVILCMWKNNWSGVAVTEMIVRKL